jgi:translation initiation factor 2 subunit 3
MELNEKLIPEVNIGLVGHVAHGKTTLTLALTGKLTLTHSEELKRGITIRLGYADATIYKDSNGHYFTNTATCPICFAQGSAQRTVSFIDVPGHETLMATVLTGASLFDGALLVIDATQKCPQPQTREHLTALEIVGIKNLIVVQNKIDLVSVERAKQSYQEIKNFAKGTILENAPIIPVSAQKKINIDAVLAAIEEEIPTPKREKGAKAKMYVARSFDVNKPGTAVGKLVGGVLGGAIVQGKFKLGDEIEIRPGTLINGKYRPLTSVITGLQKAGINLPEAGPGGLLGLMTKLDPFLTKSDSLIGNVVGLPGELPEVREKLLLQFELVERVVGLEDFQEARPIKTGENLLVNIGTARSIGTALAAKKNELELQLKIPVAAETGEKVVLSRQFAGRWRLVGYGTVL